MKLKFKINLVLLFLGCFVTIQLLLMVINTLKTAHNASLESRYQTNRIFDKNENLKSRSSNVYFHELKLNFSSYKVCTNVSRPHPANITWRKNVYQQFTVKIKNLPPRDAFVLKFYADDRFQDGRYIRGIFTVHGFGFLTKVANASEVVWQFAWGLYSATWWVGLWYEGHTYPLLARCRLGTSGGLDRKVSYIKTLNK
jgi:hypothetical protein